MTKVVNRTALATGAVFLILCGLVPKLGAHRFYYAAGCSRRRSRYDVLIHRDQRNPAGHKGEDDSEEPDYRFCSAWSWLWNGANTAILAQTPQAIQLIFSGSGIVPAAMVAILLNIVLPE